MKGKLNITQVLDNSVPVYAHAGFMNSAKSLLPEITKEISRQLSDDGSITHIIFTGHSAGGAVASLLFLHFVHHSHISCRNRSGLSSDSPND